jgi:hypothetical protein
MNRGAEALVAIGAQEMGRQKRLTVGEEILQGAREALAAVKGDQPQCE